MTILQMALHVERGSDGPTRQAAKLSHDSPVIVPGVTPLELTQAPVASLH